MPADLSVLIVLYPLEKLLKTNSYNLASNVRRAICFTGSFICTRY